MAAVTGHLRVFHQRFEEPSGVESALVRGQSRNIPADPRLVRERSVTGTLRNVVGMPLRWVAWLLVASPALIIPKLFLPRALSDSITVGFALVVVAFFAVLALYFVFSIVWWLAHRGRPGLRWAPGDATAEERTASIALDAGVAPGTPVRAIGRVVPLTDTDVVLRTFASDTPVPWRVVELVDFAVVPDEGVPLIARFVQSPVLAPLGRRGSFADHAAGFSPQARQLAASGEGAGRYLELRAGQRVELAGTVDRMLPNAESFELDGVAASLPRALDTAEAPYRRGPGDAALVVGAESAPRIFIRSLPEG